MVTRWFYIETDEKYLHRKSVPVRYLTIITLLRVLRIFFVFINKFLCRIFCTSLCALNKHAPFLDKQSQDINPQNSQIQYLLNLVLSSIQVFPRKNSTFEYSFFQILFLKIVNSNQLKAVPKKIKVYPSDGLAS